MALSLQLGYPDVPRSITNPNVQSTDVLDRNSPLPFLTFIKIINVNFEPESLQLYYNHYIKVWNTQSNSTDVDEQESIKTKYKDFLKDLYLNHTTPEELQFLSKIDFDDPYDLDIVIGFYGRKLKELINFYNEKRNKIKFNLVRNKLKGTNFGTERIISDLVLSYLKYLDGGKMLYDYDSIKNTLEVEIEELYDAYPYYLNQTPDVAKYDNKDLDYGYNIFLTDDKTLISKYLSNLSEELKDLKEVDQLFDNKRKLTEKYLSTNFYYLSTGSTSTQFLSGKLLDSSKTILNFLNRDYPTTASTNQTGWLKSPAAQGFFRPSNTSIVLVDGVNSSYTFNQDALLPNSLYFFPDPSKIGNNGDILTFTVDDSYLKKNFSSGSANNQPTSSQYDTKYFGYVSKIEPNFEKYLDPIFDEGFVEDFKSDIYNNLYGLFKNDFRYKKNIQNYPDESILNIILNGGEFYDTLYNEGSAFNYQTVDNTTYLETFRSGLSSYTGNFSSNYPDITLYFGQYTPYNELIYPTEYNITPRYEIIEGAYISKSNLTHYDDPVSSDLSSFELSNDNFYYDFLIDGGLASASPIQRALLDSSFPTLTGNLLQTTKLSSLEVVDGNNFGSPFDFIFNPEVEGYTYDGSTNSNQTSMEDFNQTIDDYPNYQYDGVLMIRNSATKQIKTLLNSMDFISSKYNSEIVQELDENVIRFDISNDILFIETPSYLVAEKITLDNNQFTNSKLPPTHITHSENEYDKISNRYKVGNDIYYYKLKTLTDTISSNNFRIYPEIYKFDTINFKNILLFPRNISDITETFDVSGDDVRFVKSDTPILTHSKRNNVFNISFMLKDQNDMANIHNLSYHLNPDVTFLNHNIYTTHSSAYSNIFDSHIQTTLNIYLSGGLINTQSGELIL